MPNVLPEPVRMLLYVLFHADISTLWPLTDGKDSAGRWCWLNQEVLSDANAALATSKRKSIARATGAASDTSIAGSNDFKNRGSWVRAATPRAVVLNCG